MGNLGVRQSGEAFHRKGKNVNRWICGGLVIVTTVAGVVRMQVDHPPLPVKL